MSAVAESPLSQGRRALGEGRLDDAARLLTLAAAQAPDDAEPHALLGITLARRNEPAAAIACHQRAVRLAPDGARWWAMLGRAWIASGEAMAGEAALLQAVHLDPRGRSARLALARSLAGRCAWSEALPWLEALARERPADAVVHAEVAIARASLGHVEDAIRACERARSLAPLSVPVLVNCGVTLMRLRRMEEAHAAFGAALALWPGDPLAGFNQSMAFLLEGDYSRGFAMYDFHRRVYGHRHSERQWDGRAARGTLLLYAQHGLGDTLQFVRYVPSIASLGCRIVLEVQDALVPLLAGMPGAAEVRGRSRPSSDFDSQATLLELPALMGHDLSTIPRATAYLAADPGRVATWSSRLAVLDAAGAAATRAASRPLRVGLAWAGNARQLDGLVRTCPLAELASLASVPGVVFHSLQKGPAADEVASVPFRVHDHSAVLDEGCGAFEDTAALMQCLDVVVSVDTATCHLAAGLGRPTWTLLPYHADWRWLLDRSDSPWYPTMRLFRQPRPGDWPSVAGAVATALSERAARRA